MAAQVGMVAAGVAQQNPLMTLVTILVFIVIGFLLIKFLFSGVMTPVNNIVDGGLDAMSQSVGYKSTNSTKDSLVLFFLYFVPLPIFLTIPLAVGFGVGLMILFNITHPPAGGNPIIVIIGIIASL